MTTWLAEFRAGVTALGIEPPDVATTAGLQVYLDTLQLWNKKINLTAVRDAKGIATRHFVDSMAVLLGLPPDTRTLLDAGSGAGLPGMVLALVSPGLRVTLCESNNKKCAFLRTLQRELRLQNTTIVPSRLEDLHDRFDAAVSRATWDITKWLDMAKPFVRPGGVVLGMEGATQCALPDGARRMVYPLAGSKRALIICST